MSECVEIDMSRRELVNFNGALQTLLDIECSRRFAYVVTRTLMNVEKEIKALEEISKPSERIKEFYGKREDIAKKYARRDSDNRPIVINNVYDLEDTVKFDEEVDVLAKEYDNDIKEWEKKKDEIEGMMDEDITVGVIQVSSDMLPDTITPRQMRGLIYMLKDDITSLDKKDTDVDVV